MNTPNGEVYKLYNAALEDNHCLIAGCTGSGKSTALNGIISTILYYPPKEKSFVIIDPKKVELSQYRHLPHCLGFETETQNIIELLNRVIITMDNRFDVMLKHGLKKYPAGYIYVIIDELASLITNKTIFNQLVKIGRLGRAAKIFLICATQSPDKKTIPAQLQQNITFTLGLRCKDRIASRQVIGFPGCELLPLCGHGYIYTPDHYKPELVQVPLVPDIELNRLINHWTPSF